MFYYDQENSRAFIKSQYVKVFPCSRRRSSLIDKDGDQTTSDKHYIPFDPEARLNTEANNRKYSSLNGFTQNYLRTWDVNEGLLSIVLGGYLFNVKLPSSYRSVANFTAALASCNESFSNTDVIYVNILLEKVPLFSNENEILNTQTEVLRNQTLSTHIVDYLDNMIPTGDGGVEVDKTDPTQYYFTGLSFSTEKLATVNDAIISEEIFKKVGGSWQIRESFKLPKIAHGETEDSIKVTGVVEAKGLALDGNVTVNKIPKISVEARTVEGNTVHRLVISGTTNS